MHRLKPWQKTMGIAILALVAFVGGYLARGWTTPADQRLVDAAYGVIANDSIFNTTQDHELAYAAIRGMLGVLDDPYSELIEPQAAENFSNTFAGKTGVVGLYAQNEDGQVVVKIAYPGGAASEAGVRVGDVLLAIDAHSLDSATDSSETGLLLRGAPDSQVRLKVRRDQQILDFELTRKPREFVSARMLPDGVGYLALNAYNSTASQQFKTALEDLLAQNPKGLVWDLRNNEGGDMLAAQEILSYLIKDGLLFRAELTQGRAVSFSATNKLINGDLPLVVLIDQTTYSAAETCAAAIEARGRGLTVGSHTYGKGLIQATVALPEKAMLQMTVARWYSPTGVWYQGSGVPPMIAAVDDPATPVDELLQRGIAVLLGK